ncbi:methyl-accepting chemotaxis protein [Geodermatophilus sp. SYSU D00698]
MWRRTDPDPSGTPETTATPRDVEVLERVVEALTEASASTGEVVRITSGIADRTGLLALDATTAAACAGELGRGSAVVTGEVEDLARETAAATQRVPDRIAGTRTSSDQVTAGIHATSEVVGLLDAVQARITGVLEEQVRMGRAVESAA